MSDDTSNTIKQAYQRAKDICSPWHDEIKDWRKLYGFDHYTGKSLPHETRYEDPTYTNVVDLAVGILLANGLEFRARGWTLGTDEMKEATHVEKFLSGILHTNSLRLERDIVYEVILNFVRDGVGILYTVWDDELASEHRFLAQVPDPEMGAKTIEGFREPPIRVDVVDPLTIFAIPGGKNRWKAVMRVEEASAFDVETEFGVRLRDTNHLTEIEKMNSKGELIDYWEEVVIEVELESGERIKKQGVRHGITYSGEVIQELEIVVGYDHLPYTINFFKPVGNGKSVEWGKSIIHPLITSVQLLEQAFNRRQRQINVYSSLSPIARTMPGRRVQVDSAIGDVIHMDINEDFGFPVWPGSPPDVDNQIALLRSKVQQSGFSDVMMGEGTNAVSGYALSQLGDQNRIRLEQPVKHLELFFTMWAKKVLKLAGAFGNGKYIRTYGKMRGRDFFDQIFLKQLSDYLVRADLKPEFPNENSRNHAMSTQVQGVLSKRQIMETYLGIDHPDEVNRQRITEMIEEHPVMIHFAIMRQLQDVIEEADDEAEVQAAQATLEAMTRQGIAGMGGRPPEEGVNPESSPGMMSASGQPTRQEQGGEAQGQSLADAQDQLASARPTFME